MLTHPRNPHQGSCFRSSITLYGLCKTQGHSDKAHRQHVQILCAPCVNGAQAIRAFVSRLDAELMAKIHARDGYQVIPLDCFDPTQPIQDHHGWLMMHICIGFTARANQLLNHNGQLMPLGWFVYVETGRWTSEHFIDWGPEMARLLQASYDSIGLPDYPAWLDELNNALETEKRWHVDQAWHTLPPLTSPDNANQHALLDPIERRWRFSSSQIEIGKPRLTVSDQGARRMG